jgi:hypothetical protein
VQTALARDALPAIHQQTTGTTLRKARVCPVPLAAAAATAVTAATSVLRLILIERITAANCAPITASIVRMQLGASLASLHTSFKTEIACSVPAIAITALTMGLASAAITGSPIKALSVLPS